IVPPMKKLLWQMTSLFSMCGSLTAYTYTAMVIAVFCLFGEIKTVLFGDLVKNVNASSAMLKGCF
ncbi:hypothetical protein, partial [Providencia huaxiensis]|uniref:hypothetical protein n=1 Tax=Providencia huaxiensis TaxID=2027290 RepID=UPI0034E539F4